MSEGSSASPSIADRARTRRLLIEGVMRALGIVVVTLVVYTLIPIEGTVGPRAAAVGAAIGLVVILVVFAWQLSHVSTSERPVLAAIEALVLVFGMFICMFALLYVSVSEGNPDAFSEELTKSGGIYFTVTVLATVGFGDITPDTDTARLIVTLQMIIGMTLIGTAFKTMSASAKSAVTTRHPTEVAELEARMRPPVVTTDDPGDRDDGPQSPRPPGR